MNLNKKTTRRSFFTEIGVIAIAYAASLFNPHKETPEGELYVMLEVEELDGNDTTERTLELPIKRRKTE